MKLVSVYTNIDRSLYCLYDLLAKRHPYQCISHKEMPAHADHVEFIMSEPYAGWYLIEHEDWVIGNAYITHKDEIGIFIVDGFHGKGIGGKVLEVLLVLHPRERYLANINPANTESIEFFAKQGFRLIQKTFEFVPNETKETE
jgi:RimJ/RimL family protein N-acetyltransferase